MKKFDNKDKKDSKDTTETVPSTNERWSKEAFYNNQLKKGQPLDATVVTDQEVEMSTAASSGATLPKREKLRRTESQDGDVPESALMSGEDTTDTEMMKSILKDDLSDAPSPATPSETPQSPSPSSPASTAK